ncbi:unnamed protein product, partial [Heterosigma akashiwo]
FLERLGIASPPAPLCSLPEDGGSKSLKTVDFSRDSSYHNTESTSPPPTRSPTVSFVSEDFDYSPADNKAPVAYIPLADQLSQISPSKKESSARSTIITPGKKLALVAELFQNQTRTR